MAYSKARRAANERYNAAHYDQISVRLPAGRKDLLEDVSINANQTMNRFINEAIATRMGISFDVWNETDTNITANGHVTNANSCPIVFRAPDDLLPKVEKIAKRYGMSPDMFMVDAIIMVCDAFEKRSQDQKQCQQGGGAEKETKTEA